MDLLEQGENRLRGYIWPLPPEVTDADYKKALTPIKAFRTRSGLKFDIVTTLADEKPEPETAAKLPTIRHYTRNGMRLHELRLYQADGTVQVSILTDEEWSALRALPEG
jgi:hypothetical protein